MREFVTPRIQRDPDYLLQQNSTNTPLSRGVTLTLPRGDLSVVDPQAIFQPAGP